MNNVRLLLILRQLKIKTKKNSDSNVNVQENDNDSVIADENAGILFLNNPCLVNDNICKNFEIENLVDANNNIVVKNEKLLDTNDILQKELTFFQNKVVDYELDKVQMIEENKESAEKIAELRIKKEKADERVQNIKSELFNAGYQNNILDLAKAKMEEENKKANDLIIELQEVVHKQQNENKAGKDLIIEYQKLVHKQKYALSTQKTLIFRLVNEKLELKMILSNDVNSNVKTKEVYEGREMIHTSS